MNMPIRNIIEQGIQELSSYPSAEAEQLLYLLLQDMFQITRTTLVAYPDTKLSNSDYNQITEAIKRLKNNEPLQYIVGFAEFYDLKFDVNESVLIPRPETEELVDWILSDNKIEEPVIVDIGTGSGCIAISLAVSLEGAKVSAVDISIEALNVAVNNARLNQVNVDFIHSNILDENSDGKLPDGINILVSNPPYVTHAQKKVMHKNVVDNEPHLALFIDDSNPLIFYKRIAEIGCAKLVDGGKLFFEINEEFGQETKDMLVELGYSEIELRKDINGKDRMVKATRTR